MGQPTKQQPAKPTQTTTLPDANDFFSVNTQADVPQQPIPYQPDIASKTSSAPDMGNVGDARANQFVANKITQTIHDIYIEPGKGLDISRTSLTMHALGELAFPAHTESKGVITRGEVLEPLMKLREIDPSLGQYLDGNTANAIISLLPEKGFTKGDMMKMESYVDNAMLAADTNGDGYLSLEEVNKAKIHVTPEMEKTYSTVLEQAKKLAGKAATDSLVHGNLDLAGQAYKVRADLYKAPENLKSIEDKNGDISVKNLKTLIHDKFGDEGHAKLNSMGNVNAVPKDLDAPLRGNAPPPTPDFIGRNN